MDEQGVSTSALNAIPKGVKANAAIESLKETEYANLTIPMSMVKKTVRRIAQRFLDLADNNFISPKTVYYLEKGEPQYFDIIGNSALEKRQEVNVETPQGVIPIKKDYKVEIEIQSGLGYTREAKKEAAIQLGEYILKLAEVGAVPPQAIQKFFESLLEAFQFGATSEIMETFKGFEPGALTDDQIEKVKLAVAEVMKDLQGSEILPTSDQRIDETKIGAAEALRDTGVVDKQRPQEPEKGPSKSISFKDLPPEGKAQLAQQAGIQLNPAQIAADEEEEKQQETDIQERQMKVAERRPSASSKR